MFPTPHSCHVLLGTARSCLRMLGPMPGSCSPASPTSPSSTRRTSTRGWSASGTELGVWKHFQTDPLDRKSRIRTWFDILWGIIAKNAHNRVYELYSFNFQQSSWIYSTLLIFLYVNIYLTVLVCYTLVLSLTL